MHACSQFDLEKLVFLVALGLPSIALAQLADVRGPMPANEANRVGAARQTNQYIMTGRLAYREHRYVLLDDRGQLEAYLVPRRAADLKRFVGQLVDATVREPILRLGNEPRLWVDRVVPVKRAAAAAGAPQLLSDAFPPGQISLAQYTEPLMSGGGVATPVAIKDVTVSNAYGLPGRIWGSAEYLLWWADGMDLPPLVTTSPNGTPREQAGVLGAPGTLVLYGNENVLNSVQHGLRLKAGFWFDPDNRYGIQGEYFGLQNYSDRFAASGDANGLPILARPFFNVNPRDPLTNAFDPPAREDSELIAFPNLVTGNIGVDVSTRLESGALALRTMLACDTHCNSQGTGFSRTDMILGYRYLRLKDKLRIANRVDSLDRQFPVSFEVYDQFETSNKFHGLDLGLAWQAGWQRWTVDMLLKTAIGSVSQNVSIQGGTTITEPNLPPVAHTGGLLALPTNIGSYSRQRFAVVPEFGANARFAIMRQLHATIGYSLIYMGSVVRPGDQIDRDVNPDQLPPPIVPMAGALRPEFSFQESSYWVHGLSFGIEGRW